MCWKQTPAWTLKAISRVIARFHHRFTHTHVIQCLITTTWSSSFHQQQYDHHYLATSYQPNGRMKASTTHNRQKLQCQGLRMKNWNVWAWSLSTHSLVLQIHPNGFFLTYMPLWTCTDNHAFSSAYHALPTSVCPWHMSLSPQHTSVIRCCP